MGIDSTQYVDGSSGKSITAYKGEHLVEITQIQGGKTQQGTEKLVISMIVHGSLNEALQEEIKEAGAPVPAATVFLKGQWDQYFYSDIRRLLGAVQGVEPSSDQPWGAWMASATGGDLGVGTKLKCTVLGTGKVTASGKNQGKEICNVTWEPVS